jgi:hypothetical protein
MTPLLAEFEVPGAGSSSLCTGASRRVRRIPARLHNGFDYGTLVLQRRLANPSALHRLRADTLRRDLLYGCRIGLMGGCVSTLTSLDPRIRHE